MPGELRLYRVTMRSGKVHEVYALSAEDARTRIREAKIPIRPTGKPEHQIRSVKRGGTMEKEYQKRHGWSGDVGANKDAGR